MVRVGALFLTCFVWIAPSLTAAATISEEAPEAPVIDVLGLDAPIFEESPINSSIGSTVEPFLTEPEEEQPKPDFTRLK